MCFLRNNNVLKKKKKTIDEPLIDCAKKIKYSPERLNLETV